MKKVIAFLAVVLCFSATTVMAQPPGGGGGGQMTPEQRAAQMKERLAGLNLNLNPAQTDSAVAIMGDRSYTAGMTRDTPAEERQAKMKEANDAREKRLVKAGIAADVAKKIIEGMSFRPGGGGGGRQ